MLDSVIHREGNVDAPKYVASTTLHEPLPWPNSTLLVGDVVGAVGALRAQSDGVLAIMGSGELIRSLRAADLIDEYLLLIHPLVLGSGRRLFPEGSASSALTLVRLDAAPSGVLVADYTATRAT